jgi:hypothetical protein
MRLHDTNEEPKWMVVESLNPNTFIEENLSPEVYRHPWQKGTLGEKTRQEDVVLEVTGFGTSTASESLFAVSLQCRVYRLAFGDRIPYQVTGHNEG